MKHSTDVGGIWKGRDLAAFQDVVDTDPNLAL
jgi:hypothetical protein